MKSISTIVYIDDKQYELPSGDCKLTGRYLFNSSGDMLIGVRTRGILWWDKEEFIHEDRIRFYDIYQCSEEKL